MKTLLLIALPLFGCNETSGHSCTMDIDCGGLNSHCNTTTHKCETIGSSPEDLNAPNDLTMTTQSSSLALSDTGNHFSMQTLSSITCSTNRFEAALPTAVTTALSIPAGSTLGVSGGVPGMVFASITSSSGIYYSGGVSGTYGNGTLPTISMTKMQSATVDTTITVSGTYTACP